MKTSLIIVVIAASTCLFAADAPKTLSSDFTKAALKALIIVKNGDRYLSTIDSIRYRGAVEDAEVAAASDNEKTTLAAIRNYRVRRSHDGSHLTAHRLKAIDENFEKTGKYDVLLDVPDDPETAKDMVVTDACAADLEKVLRSGVFAAVPSCDVTNDRPTVTEGKPANPLCNPALIAAKKKILPDYTAPSDCNALAPKK